MYRKLFALIALFAVLFSVAFAQDFSANIKLKVFEDSNKNWLAVDPLGDNDATMKVEMLESTSNDWVEMTPDAVGYWQAKSTSLDGFALPMSFRLTSKDGQQVILDNVMSTISAGKALETAAQFQRSARNNHDGRDGDDENGRRGGNDDENGRHGGGSSSGVCPSGPSSTHSPTQRPSSTHAPTQQPATHAPTQQPATHAPTQQPATHAPTQHPTQPSTQAPTQRPTQRPSSPTSAPTTRPSTGSSTPTTKPTSAPTTKPSTGSSSGSSNTDLCAVTPTSQEPVKILVPLYQEPGNGWDDLITAANAGTSIIAIINPDNGPVSSGPPSNWVTYMNKMNQAGIDMVGYVHTSYGARSISDVKSEIDTYANKYTGLKGIFLDEVSADKSEIPYYQQAYTYIMGKSGYVHDILNPGATTDSGYVAVSTNIVVYESSASSYRNPSSSFIKCAPSAAEKAGYKYRFSGIAYGASQSQMTSIASQMAGAGLGMVFITDRDLPNPYDPLPSYWTTEASTVKNL